MLQTGGPLLWLPCFWNVPSLYRALFAPVTPHLVPPARMMVGCSSRVSETMVASIVRPLIQRQKMINNKNCKVTPCSSLAPSFTHSKRCLLPISLQNLLSSSYLYVFFLEFIGIIVWENIGTHNFISEVEIVMFVFCLNVSILLDPELFLRRCLVVAFHCAHYCPGQITWDIICHDLVWVRFS